MRTRNALERLAAAAPAVELAVDAAEEEQILARILESRRATPRRRRRRAPVLLLAGAVVAAAGTVAAVELTGSKPAAPVAGGHGHIALTGARIDLAGYQFRTPAGFTASVTSCPGPSNATPDRNRFSAAASADGGCVEAAALIADNLSGAPSGSVPVDVGSYQGYFISQDSAGESTLYIAIPDLGGHAAYVVLVAQGLTEDQLMAVGASGLPTLLHPTPTTGTETTN